jgi:hypothetical protein
MADMAGTVAAIEPAIAYDYKGWTVGKCGPWSQGPVLLQCLALLKVRNHGVFSLVALHGLCAVLKISHPRAQGIRARKDAAGLPGVHPHRRRAPLAVPTPMNRSWGPRNIYCCESLWKMCLNLLLKFWEKINLNFKILRKITISIEKLQFYSEIPAVPDPSRIAVWIHNPGLAT